MKIRKVTYLDLSIRDSKAIINQAIKLVDKIEKRIEKIKEQTTKRSLLYSIKGEIQVLICETQMMLSNRKDFIVIHSNFYSEETLAFMEQSGFSKLKEFSEIVKDK